MTGRGWSVVVVFVMGGWSGCHEASRWLEYVHGGEWMEMQDASGGVILPR